MVREAEPDPPGELSAEHWVRAIVDGYFDGLTLAVDGRIIAANDTFARMFGYESHELIGKTPLDLATPESAQAILARIREGNEAPYEAVGVRKDGSTFACEIVGRNVSFRGQRARVTSFRDVTERRALENENQRVHEQMMHAQRLENLGVLAGGIAHDFNNLLQVIVGSLDLARLTLPPTPESARAHSLIAEAMSAASQAAELSRQMLAYSGKATLVIERCNLDELVREASAHAAGHESAVAVQLELSAELPPIDADGAQLRQVISNLLVNAFEAVGDTREEVLVRTGTVTLETAELAFLRVNTTPGPGEFAYVEIEDGGKGMSSETLDRMFDPFFTTKQTGRGLGLAAVLGIVRAHHGGIDVWSEPQRGSRFRVLFPAQRRRSSASPPDEARAAVAPKALQGRILLADDERNLRAVLRQGLSSFGLDVVEAEDGRRALELFQRDPAGFDLLVIDMTMPGLGGAAVLDEVRRLRPDVPVVLASGYTDYELDSKQRREHTAFLAKPFHLGDLVGLVRVMLKEKR